MIEPDAPTTPRPSRTKAAVVGATLLGLLTLGVAVLAGGDDQGDRLALVTGGQAGSQSERLAAPAASGAAADKAMPFYPGYSGIEYRVEGSLPDLGSTGAAWKIRGRELDRAAASRLSEALGLRGEPTLRDGAWVLETAEGNFNAYFDGSAWSLNYNRTPAGRPAGTNAATGDLTAADAERVARAVLGRMGALEGEWRAQRSEADFGISVGCASPAYVGDPGELKKLEAEKLARAPEAQISNDSSVSSGSVSSSSGSSGSTPADRPVSSPPSGDVVDACLQPEPAPTSKGFAVSFFPVLDGVRADLNGWSVLVSADERIENLYGLWATYEQAGDFKLRSVDAALAELRSGGGSRPVPMAAAPPMGIEPDMGAPQPAIGVAEPAIDMAEPAVDMPKRAGGTEPADGGPGIAIDPAAPAPDIAPCPRGTGTKEELMFPERCGTPPAPQVVTITGVERSLIPMGVYTGGQQRLHLVPAYRFTGTFEGGEAYETSVLALHPDAIAPPPPPESPQTEPGRPPFQVTPGPGGVGGGGSSGSSGSGISEPGSAPSSKPGVPATDQPPSRG